MCFSSPNKGFACVKKGVCLSNFEQGNEGLWRVFMFFLSLPLSLWSFLGVRERSLCEHSVQTCMESVFHTLGKGIRAGKSSGQS